MAWSDVHSLAKLSCSSLFSKYFFAISGTKGSLGFGSFNKEQIDNNRLEKISKSVIFTNYHINSVLGVGNSLERLQVYKALLFLIYSYKFAE